jgi:hypothetical protein
MFLKYKIVKTFESLPVDLRLHYFWSTAESLFFKSVLAVAPSVISNFYKQCFVISHTSLSVSSIIYDIIHPYLNYFLFWFFSSASRWFRYIHGETRWSFEKTLGMAWSIKDFLADTLRNRRTFLMHFGQRRVCTRASVWSLPGFFAQLQYDSEPYSAVPSNSFCFTYKHLHKSNSYPAGLLLNHPNFHLFIHIMSNPYFWLIMQQTMHSQYRY